MWRGPPKPPSKEPAGMMTLEYFMKNYTKPFKNRPNVLEVPFDILHKQGWKYNHNDKTFTKGKVELDDGA